MQVRRWRDHFPHEIVLYNSDDWHWLHSGCNDHFLSRSCLLGANIQPRAGSVSSLVKQGHPCRTSFLLLYPTYHSVHTQPFLVIQACFPPHNVVSTAPPSPQPRRQRHPLHPGTRIHNPPLQPLLYPLPSIYTFVFFSSYTLPRHCPIHVTLGSRKESPQHHPTHPPQPRLHPLPDLPLLLASASIRQIPPLSRSESQTPSLAAKSAV